MWENCIDIFGEYSVFGIWNSVFGNWNNVFDIWNCVIGNWNSVFGIKDCGGIATGRSHNASHMSHHRQSIPTLNWDPDQIPALLYNVGHEEDGDYDGDGGDDHCVLKDLAV